MQLQKIPTTIVTGFLGSGKTTLMSNILKQAEGRRIAVIVNEFGELGIDGDLLQGCGLGCDEGEASEQEGQVYELANGCLCCTVQEEFFPVMQELVKRRDDIDHILIETSGLALPKPLVQAFNWPEIKSACTVDAVITVVDCPAVVSGMFAANPTAVDAQRQADPNLDHNASLHELFEDQLSAADLVVLSKTDLIDPEVVEQVRQIVMKEVPEQVKLVESDQGRLPLDIVLGLDAASEETIDQRHDHHHHHHEENGDHHHDHDHDAFDSIVVRLGDVDGDKLLACLQQAVADHTVFRVKGFASLAGKPMRQVLHGVGERFDSYFDRRWEADEQRDSCIVLIGQGLDQAKLEACLAPAAV